MDKPIWNLVSKTDHRWVCSGCYLECVQESNTEPKQCRREIDEQKKLGKNQKRGIDPVGL